MKLCTVSGCERKHVAKGLCTMHRERMKRTGSLDRKIRGAGEGTILETGYWADYAPQHPLARKNGRVLRHRASLYDVIGDGEHSCHWCGVAVRWTTGALRKSDNPLIVDHIDRDRRNNDIINLVPSCMDCNIRRDTRAHDLARRLTKVLSSSLSVVDENSIRDAIEFLDKR